NGQVGINAASGHVHGRADRQRRPSGKRGNKGIPSSPGGSNVKHDSSGSRGHITRQIQGGSTPGPNVRSHHPNRIRRNKPGPTPPGVQPNQINNKLNLPGIIEKINNPPRPNGHGNKISPSPPSPKVQVGRGRPPLPMRKRGNKGIRRTLGPSKIKNNGRSR